MRTARNTGFVLAMLLVGCASEVLPGFRPVPEPTIDALPARIARLPVTDGMPMDDFLTALGLREYAGNLTGSIRFNSNFLTLDDEHTLQIRHNPESLVITRESIDRILNEEAPMNQDAPVGEGAMVIGCTLRRDWDEVLAHRLLAEPGT